MLLCFLCSPYSVLSPRSSLLFFINKWWNLLFLTDITHAKKDRKTDRIREHREWMPKGHNSCGTSFGKSKQGQYVRSTQMRPCKDAWRITRVSHDTSRRSTIKPYYVGPSDIDCRFKPLKLIHSLLFNGKHGQQCVAVVTGRTKGAE